MLLDYLTLKPEAFGLDISDLSLKIVKLEKKGRFFDLASFGETKMTPGIIKVGEIQDEKVLTEMIKKALAEVKGKKIKTKYVIASLPEEKAFLQVIQFPKMTPEEVKKAVFFEAENHIPLPISEVYLDCQIIPPVENHLDHCDVLIAALPKATVDPYVFSLKKAGLKPLALEIESQAISRALVKEGFTLKPLLLIDLGENRTSFIIFSGYSLRFTASLPISSQKFTEIIAKYQNINLQKAEDIKLKYGIGKTKQGIQNFQALKPALNDLLEQIKKYLNYYRTHAAHEHLPADGKKFEKILLCGGGVNLKGLIDFLYHELGLPIELANPWANISLEPQKTRLDFPYQESLRYTTALGLALRGIKEESAR